MITWDMISSYISTENDEMVVESCIKAIKTIEGEKNYTSLLRQSTQMLCYYLELYYMVSEALMRLKRLTDGAHFINECIEAHFLALSYNPQEEIVDKAHRKIIYWYDQSRFIGRFQKLITCQIENKCYSDALKAFKRFKIHGLNSTNPKNKCC